MDRDPRSSRIRTDTPLNDTKELLTLGSDFARVREDPSTDMRLKKRIVRSLVEEIVVDVNEAGDTIEAVRIPHSMSCFSNQSTMSALGYVPWGGPYRTVSKSAFLQATSLLSSVVNSGLSVGDLAPNLLSAW